MPRIIKTIDEIMDREKRDTLFIDFKALQWRRSRGENPSRQRHFEWFDANGLTYEPAAPRGWLEGDPGIYVVYFDGPDDPRIAQYSAEFEGADGMSLVPSEYQMTIISFRDWMRRNRLNTSGVD